MEKTGRKWPALGKSNVRISTIVIDGFVHLARPGRVVFGSGSVALLGEELAALGIRRAVLFSTPGQASLAGRVARHAGAAVIISDPHAAMHTPVEVSEEALALVRRERVDGLIAVGGGSAIGLAKAVALRTDLPQLHVPTTYAGSEMTPVLGETAEGVKRTLTDPRVQSKTVIYDVDLTLTLPPQVSAASGLNAIAHAVEALYAKDCSPLVTMIASEGIAALAESLPVIVQAPDDVGARTRALYGAWLCGICLGAVGMALHHKLCHTLGGSFGLPHAEAHAVILPHALAYNAPAVPEAMTRLRTVLGDDPAVALHDLGRAIGIPTGLKALGMAEADVDRAAEIALSKPYWNPRPLEVEGLRALLRRAWAGVPPQSLRS